MIRQVIELLRRTQHGLSRVGLTGLMAVAAVTAAHACERPPAAVKNLDLSRYYSDRDGTIIDPESLDRHRDAVGPLTAFLRHVTADADKSLRRTAPKAQAEAAACAVEWLAAWASEDAWLGDVTSKQAEYQRKWDLAGVALTYLKVRSFAKAEQRAVIEPWLERFADRARSFFDDPSRKRNNHWYWLGLGLAATALATDSPRHWAEARGIMTDASADIRADGALPAELDRKSRALQYHTFSLMPLIAMAELAHAKGEDWYALGDGALHRLAALCMRGLADPDVFDRLAKARQDRPVRPGAGWLQLYASRFKDRIPAGMPDIAPGHRWLGGDVLLLADVLKFKK